MPKRSLPPPLRRSPGEINAVADRPEKARSGPHRLEIAYFDAGSGALAAQAITATAAKLLDKDAGAYREETSDLRDPPSFARPYKALTLRATQRLRSAMILTMIEVKGGEFTGL